MSRQGLSFWRLDVAESELNSYYYQQMSHSSVDFPIRIKFWRISHQVTWYEWANWNGYFDNKSRKKLDKDFADLLSAAYWSFSSGGLVPHKLWPPFNKREASKVLSSKEKSLLKIPKDPLITLMKPVWTSSLHLCALLKTLCIEKMFHAK